MISWAEIWSVVRDGDIQTEPFKIKSKRHDQPTIPRVLFIASFDNSHNSLELVLLSTST